MPLLPTILPIIATAIWLILPAIAHAGDPRIASTDPAEVCASDGKPGSSYSRQHRTFHGSRPGYEHDHIVSLCLGGADTDANLQWQALSGPWNARDKDRLEAELCRRVCRYRTMELGDAQRMLYTDWRAGYVEIFGANPESASEGRQ